MTCAEPILSSYYVIHTEDSAGLYHYQDTIVVECRDGYSMDGDVRFFTAECDEEGSWNPPLSELPSCVFVSKSSLDLFNS